MTIPDIHLGGSSVLGKTEIGSQLNSRVIDQLNLLNWSLDQAIAHDVSTIILTGDIFDHPKPPSTLIVLFIEWLKKCIDAGISIHVILGNHDLLRSGQNQFSSLDIIAASEIENVFVHKTISTIHMDDVSFTLMPFKDRRSFNMATHDEAINILANRLPYELAEISRNNMKVIIGHLAIKGSIPALDEIEDTSNELFCPVEMFYGYDQVIMGHIHKFQHITPSIGHIGSLDISNFGETNQDKYIAIINPDASDPLKYIEIPTRRLNQVSISVPANITDTTAYVLDELENQKPYLRKSITKVGIVFENPDVVSVDREVIEKYLVDAGVFHVAAIREERKVSAVKRTSEEFDDTVNETAAIRIYSQGIEEEFRDEFVSLANDVVKECTT
jgi:DNA repair exonuclease SbcCD nuclease subunit